MQCMGNAGCIPAPGESEQPWYGATQLLLFFFLCAVFLCFRNPPNSMDYRIFNVRTYVLMRAYTHGRWGTPTMSQHNILTRKNSLKFFLCSRWESNLWSWNPLDFEADALPTEPPRPQSTTEGHLRAFHWFMSHTSPTIIHSNKHKSHINKWTQFLRHWPCGRQQ